MKVEIWFEKSNQPIKFDGVYALYQKGDLICIGYISSTGNKRVSKYPIDHIFTISEYDFETSQPTI